jgi:hypothetical protein
MSNKRSLVVYVAGPFRAQSSHVRLFDAEMRNVGVTNCWEVEKNIRRAEELAWQVWAAGFTALCPHTNTRFYQNSLPDDTWLEGDLVLLSRCDLVLMTPDWERSAGARAERDFALAHGIPVFYDLRALVDFGEAAATL